MAVPTGNIDFGNVTLSVQNLNVGNIKLPNNTVGDDQVNATKPIQATKLEHQHCHRIDVGSGSSLTGLTRALFVARAAGVVQKVRAFVLVGGSGGTGAVDIVVKKNGTSILSATFEILQADGTDLIEAALATTDYVADDVFTVVVTVAGGGTPPQGLYLEAVVREAAG